LSPLPPTTQKVLPNALIAPAVPLTPVTAALAQENELVVGAGLARTTQLPLKFGEIDPPDE
jgi:hypothetical protein